MIYEKKTQIDNSDNAKFLRISADPNIDFSQNITTVRLTRLNSPDLQSLIAEFTSTTQIFNARQTNSYSFAIPISQGQFILDILLHNDEGVNDFYIQKEY